MQAKQGKGQPIRADGIRAPPVDKVGTPTMGGLMILAGHRWSATLLWADLTNPYIWIVLLRDRRPTACWASSTTTPR